jgi:hypothetical protein
LAGQGRNLGIQSLRMVAFHNQKRYALFDLQDVEYVTRLYRLFNQLQQLDLRQMLGAGFTDDAHEVLHVGTRYPLFGAGGEKV